MNDKIQEINRQSSNHLKVLYQSFFFRSSYASSVIHLTITCNFYIDKSVSFTDIIMPDGIPSKSKWNIFHILHIFFYNTVHSPGFLVIIVSNQFLHQQADVIFHNFLEFHSTLPGTRTRFFQRVFLLLTDLLIPSYPHSYPFNGQNQLSVT